MTRLSHETGAEPRGVTLRWPAILLGLLLVPLNCYWIIAAEMRWYVILTLNPLFITPVFNLFVLVVLNRLLRRFRPAWVFRPAELITVYIMVVLSCTIATHDFMINLITTLSFAEWSGIPETFREGTLMPLMPKWLFPTNRELLRGYFTGNADFYRADILLMWAKPLAYWFIFIASIGWSMFCIAVIFRRAWAEETKLSFPIIRLPMELTASDGPTHILRSRVMWAGFAIAAGICIINTLHLWFPNVPHIATRATQIPFNTPPWHGLNPIFVAFYPFAIGLCYLVPLDISFSCWFFYLFMKMQAVIGAWLGYQPAPYWPYHMEQGIGAWTVFAISLIYTARHYLARVWQSVLKGRSELDSVEPISYRAAVIGLIVSLGVFFVFWWTAGMSPGWVLIVMALYFLVALAITRVRAECGSQHTVWDLEPMNVMRLVPSETLSQKTMMASIMSHWYWRLNRSHVAPAEMEALKMGGDHGMNLRSLVLPMALAFAVAIVAGMWASLHILYREGAQARCVGWANWTAWECYSWLNTATTTGFSFEAPRWIAVSGAAIFTAFLAAMRSMFSWWPFHPLGYCIGGGLIWHWVAFFIAWLIKLCVIRYGGLKLYSKTVPFFLGLILGDYVFGAITSLIGITMEVPVHNTFH